MIDRPTIALIFRRPGSSGYFSIERSFDAIAAELSADERWDFRRVIANHVSKGIFPRLKILTQMWRLRFSVYHISGDIHFAALAMPKRHTILTIHDCGFLNHPKPLARFLLRLFWLKGPVQRCHFVTAVSQATKEDIIRHTGCNPEKITVIPSVIPEQFKPNPRPFLRKKPRILHIGAAPNKNLARHIEALREIPCTLHIVAELGSDEINLLKQYRINYECTPELSDKDLVSAFENCDVLLFASTFEGFGMPILEAQSVGRPVVTGNCSSMPEVAGDGACLVDPFDVHSIRDGVLRVIQDAAYRQKLVQNGFENTKRFQAKTVARQYLELYRRLLDES